MPKTVTATEAKTNFDAMLEWTVTEKDQIVVQSHGQPKAAIINYADYTQYITLKEKNRREQAWQEMESLRKEVSARNTDLSEEEIYALADFITGDTINSMIAEDKLQYGGTASAIKPATQEVVDRMFAEGKLQYDSAASDENLD